MLVAVLIASSWLIAGISAFYLARGLYRPFARKTLSASLALMAVFLPWQLFIGDNVAGTLAKYQPAKLVTVEGNYNSTNNGYNLFVIPDPGAGKDLFRIEIPHLESLYLHDLSGNKAVPGINVLPKNVRPNVYLLFYGFRAMFYSALIMFATTMVGLYLRLRRKLYVSRRFLRWVTWTTPLGVLAIVGGWIVAEAGRQPFVVYGVLRTSNAVSHLSAPSVIFSFVGFVSLYVVMLTVWIAYVVRQVRRGPEPIELLEPPSKTPTLPASEVEVDADVDIDVAQPVVV
jgi:cytochrome d ubiquinol oxidase subunit I